MGSSQSVPRDSPLACVKWNLKPLLLTNLKGHKLKSLCTQIWPQYKLDNQNRWPEFGIFYFNILSDITNFIKQNGKCSEVPCIQDFWNLRSRPSLCKDCSTYQTSCFLSPSTTKESKSKDLKRPPKPSAPDFNPAVEPPSYRPGDEASRDKTSPSSPSSSKLGSNDPPKPQKRFPLPLHWPGPEANTCFYSENKQDQRAYTGSCAFLNFRYEPNWRKIGIFFRKSY